MKKIFKRAFSALMSLMLVAAAGNFNITRAEADTSTSKSIHTLWVIGDSTVSAFNDSYYYPRYGYGTQLDNYIDSSKFVVKNLALSGRSSKSYTQDPEYKTLLDGMDKGDYLLIGFGHNDEKNEDARYTNPNGDYKDDGSFENSLYKNYIEKAEDKGCRVILCTPIVRRTDTGVWADSNLHITTTAGAYAGGDYSEAIRDLGSDLSIPVIDMTNLTKDVYDDLGPSGTLYLHAWTSSNPLSVDNTHTNIWGGKYNAYLVAKQIKDMGIDDICDAVLDDKIANAPTKKDNLKVNPDYSEKEYDPNLKESSLWKDAGIWKGTVFGNVGDVPTKDNFSLSGDENGNVNIAVKNNKGKISSTEDGLAMYYYKVPVGSTFTLTATADINSILSNNQVSFGLMARDDMYIDTFTQSPLGDYVAAGPLRIAASPWNCFARKSGALVQGGTVSSTSINPGDSVQLKIQSNSDGYACTFGNETSVTGGFDFALTSVDSKYVYVGMFVSRNADITFKDIRLVVDGKEISNDSITDDNQSTDSKDDNINDTDSDNNHDADNSNEDKNNENTTNNNSDSNKNDDKTTSSTHRHHSHSSKTHNDDVDLEEEETDSKVNTDNQGSNDKLDTDSKEDAVKQNAVNNSGWKEINYKWYFLNSDGSYKKGWVKDCDGRWYMLDQSNGEMLTGWFKDYDGKWYYLNPISNGFKGSMLSGWIQDSTGTWYYMYSDGSMAYNTEISGYYLDLNGAWIA